MKPAISVHNLSKQYRIGKKPSRDNNLTENIRRQVRTAWDKVSRLVTPNKEFDKDESFWALKDVSFEVQPGEVVGIIGRNGAGKSTLLKILSQIVEPTSGHADIRGRMGSLLEVGTGFHPELTGRENIYLNGAILGMKRHEITAKFDEIVAFAEVEKFLDTPVKRYSSGMHVRLAFAVAAHLEPEILIVDEVLAVGDVGFQNKCLGKMSEVAKNGRTVLVVSHNMEFIQRICSTAFLMNSGNIEIYNDTHTVVSLYFSQSHRNNTKPVYLHNSVYSKCVIKVNGIDVGTSIYLTVDDPLKIQIFTESVDPASCPRVDVGIYSDNSTKIAGIVGDRIGVPPPEKSTAWVINYELRFSGLNANRIRLDFGLRSGPTGIYDVLWERAIEVIYDPRCSHNGFSADSLLYPDVSYSCKVIP